MTRFTPGIIDYDGVMATHYPRGRALSSQAADTWRATLRPLVPRPGLTILDLGSGTGRFSTFLSESFGARVIGVEPSRGMRSLAARNEHPREVRFVAGSAEGIPLRSECCDLVWMSQVLHHVRSQDLCAGELRRVVRDTGRVLVRGTFAEGEKGFPTLLKYFPGVGRVFPDLPTIPGTIATFGSHRLTLETHRRVSQQICASLREFAERTRLRADSSLALLSDDEFAGGMSALDQDAYRESDPEPVVETLDLLVFRVSER